MYIYIDIISWRPLQGGAMISTEILVQADQGWIQNIFYGLAKEWLSGTADLQQGMQLQQPCIAYTVEFKWDLTGINGP